MDEFLPKTFKLNDAESLIQNLLNWYGREGRELPWRIHPRWRRAASAPDPYSVWLSEVMLQQTTAATAAGYYRAFLSRWPTVEDLAAADDSEVMAAWAGLGYYARARNLLKCARRIAGEFGGEFPAEVSELTKLPGIGPYTASAVSSIAFGRPSAAVDGNIERVLSRLFAVDQPYAKAKSRIRALAGKLCPAEQPGDWLQALMDLGALVCRPRHPKCDRCPVSEYCLARQRGLEMELPRKPPRRRREIQRGTLFLGCRRDGAWLMEQRPKDGLFGGMLGWPGSGWGGSPRLAPPCDGEWRAAGEVRHILTHIELRLEIQAALLPMGSVPERGEFVGREKFCAEKLPTLMKKAHLVAENCRPATDGRICAPAHSKSAPGFCADAASGSPPSASHDSE